MLPHSFLVYFEFISVLSYWRFLITVAKAVKSLLFVFYSILFSFSLNSSFSVKKKQKKTTFLWFVYGSQRNFSLVSALSKSYILCRFFLCFLILGWISIKVCAWMIFFLFFWGGGLDKIKLATFCRGWSEGSFFNSYYTEV